MERSLEELLARMLSWFTSLTDKVTDFTIGSVIRALFEAVALELEELYTYVRREIRRAIVESAYTVFGFTKQEAMPARVELTFTLNPQHSGFTLPAGFLVSTKDGVQFATTIDASVAPGERSVVVPAVCTTPGFIGNVPPNTITRLVSSNPWVLAVTNPFPATGGVDEESESTRRKRFTQYIQSLSRGTRKAILFGLSTIPELSYVQINEDLPGLIRIYVSTPSGDVDQALLDRIHTTIRDWVAAGIQVAVYPVAVIRLPVTVEATIAKWFDPEEYKRIIEFTTVNYLNSRNVGEDFIPEHLAGVIIGVNPEAIRTVTVTPKTRVGVADHQVVRPGEVHVRVVQEESV